MPKNELTKAQHKKRLINVFKGRRMLFLSGFITPKESDKIHERFLKYQEKHRINISKKDLGL